jgi:hypothetical protein
MANQARVTSTDALEAFRANLILFIGKAHRALDDTGDEVRRTRQWVQHDQRMHWEGEFRKRTKVLDQTQQELMSTRLTGNHETALLVRQAAVNKAKRALDEAQEKLRCVKGWAQNYDSCADPMVKKLEGMRQLLNSDLPKAVSYLLNVEKTLESYASGPAPTGTVAPDAVPEEKQDGETP